MSHDGVNQAPHILKFQTDANKYIYDLNTNRFFKANDILYKIIDYYGIWPNEIIIERFKNLYKEEDIKTTLELILKLNKNNGFFKPKTLKHFKLGIDKKEYEYNLAHKVGFITLNVTENCNLRCDYCIFDPNNKPLRSHSNKMMCWETAKNAVDFISKRWDEADYIGIGFYGGEPFLNFPIMKDSLAYFKEKAKLMKDKQQVITVTTNGTILDAEKIKWLVDNNVGLMISLDGPEIMNDRYRKFKNGKGIFKKVINNLELIHSIDNNYYFKNVSFSIVLAPPYDFVSFYKFFTGSKTLNEIGKRISYLNSRNCEAFVKRFTNEEHDFDTSYDSLHIKYLEKLKNNIFNENRSQENNLLHNLYGQHFSNIYNRPIWNAKNILTIIPCQIGITKLFADVNGNLYPCANSNELLKELCIGDINNGFYQQKDKSIAYQRMEELVDLINIHCLNCWAVGLCEKLCFTHFDSTSIKTLDVFEKSCISRKQQWKKLIIDYFTIEDKNPTAFKFLDLHKYH